MAIDTRDRRASVANIGMTFPVALPIPDGTIVEEDRRIVALTYAGLAPTEGSGGGGTGDAAALTIMWFFGQI